VGPSAQRRVYVIVLNWNGWLDTIECLESVLRSDYPDFRVIVCDNGSTDGSFDRLNDWCSGNISVAAQNRELAFHVEPNVEKPIDFATTLPCADGLPDAKVILHQNGCNLGFAGGNNRGIELALKDPACAFVWLVNSDTVVCADALSHLVSRCNAAPPVGMRVRLSTHNALKERYLISQVHRCCCLGDY
jgi:GT2 family glycosyltransferase